MGLKRRAWDELTVAATDKVCHMGWLVKPVNGPCASVAYGKVIKAATKHLPRPLIRSSITLPETFRTDELYDVLRMEARLGGLNALFHYLSDLPPLKRSCDTPIMIPNHISDPDNDRVEELETTSTEHTDSVHT